MVYENSRYVVSIGVPPKTREFPEPINSYLVHNKETGVLEYFDSVLYRAKETADQLRDLLDGKKPPNPYEEWEKAVEDAKDKGTFQ
jgi:hypothetical protein